MATATSDKQKNEDRLRSSNESSQKTIRTLENRITSLQGDLDLARSEMESVHAEYEGYKVSSWSNVYLAVQAWEFLEHSSNVFISLELHCFR